MRDKIFKTANIVCLIGLVLSTIPSEAFNSWLGYFGLVKNEAQAGIIEPIDETDWHPFTDNAIRKRNPDGSWTANFYQNDRYIYYQDRWQLKRDLLEVTVGDNEEIVFSYGDREFKLVPYVYFHGEKYLYETLNPLVKEQINLQGEIKENGQKWQHTLNKAQYLDKISFTFEPAELIRQESDQSIILDDFSRLSFVDLVESGYQITLTEEQLVVEGLKEGINVLDPTDTFYSTDAADGYIIRSEPDQTFFEAYPSTILDELGFDFENDPINEDGAFYRAYFSFDTSGIPDGALSSISATAFYIYVESFSYTSKWTPGPEDWLYKYYCDTDDIGASLDTSDWGLSSPTLCNSNKEFGGPGNEGWKSVTTLNAYINKGGDTDIEIRNYGVETADKHALSKYRDTAYTGTAYDPYLTVTYTEYAPVQKNWRWYEDVNDFRLYHTYFVDDYDAQAYEGGDSDGSFNDDDGEFSSGDYGNIDGDDSNIVYDNEPDPTGVYQYHRFVFTIDESTSDIYRVDVTWKGYGEDDDGNYGASLWIEENSSWIERDSGTSSSSETLSYSYTSSFTDIISGGTMEVAAQTDVNGGRDTILRSYYAEVKVYYNTLDEDLGAENAKPYTNTVFWTQHFKLRVTLENEGTIDGDNIRKYLQYSTNLSSWTTVSENDAGSPDDWRYGDATECGGTDDALLPDLLLTDSDTLATHNEEGDSASTYDHAASDLAEYEFCIEDYSADPGTVYYFRVYDTDLPGEVPLDTAETYPQLLTSEIPVRSGPQGTYIDWTTFAVYDDRKMATKFLAPSDLDDWKISFYGKENATVTDNLAVDLCVATDSDDYDSNCNVLEKQTMDLTAGVGWQADLAFTYDIKEGNYYWLHYYVDGTSGSSLNYYLMYNINTRLREEKVLTTTNSWTGTTEGGMAGLRIKNSGGTDQRIYEVINGAANQDLPTANTYQIYEPPGDLTITHVYFRFTGRKGDGSNITLAICNHDTGCSSDIATKTFTFEEGKGLTGWTPIELDDPVDLTGGTAYRFKIDNTTSGDWDTEFLIYDPGSESIGGTSDYMVWNGSSYTSRDFSFWLANHTLNEDAELDNANVSNGTTVSLNTATEKYAFKISPTVNGTISSVTVNLYKTGSPSDNFDISFQTDSSGVPSGSSLATDTIAGSSLGTSYAWVTFSGFSAVGLSAGADYWVVMERDGATDSTNYYRLLIALQYKDLFHLEYYTGATWGQDGQNSSVSAEVVTSAETIQQEWRAPLTALTDNFNEWYAQSMTPEVQKEVKGFLAPIGRQYIEESQATATISIYNDSSGDPGSEQSGTKTVIRPHYQDDQSIHGGHIPMEMTSSFTMSASTTYWLVVKGLDSGSADKIGWHRKDWNTDSESYGGTSDVAKATGTGGSSWFAQSDDWVFWAIEEPYEPGSRNWRFYGDESSTTPSSPYAAENTAPNGTIGDDDVFKLRITVEEIGKNSGIANSKKRLQYDTTSDFSGTPTYVGESGSGIIWRYSTSCGGADNGVLDGRVLSDSDTSGTYNESGTSMTTLDHDISELMEFEFCLENHGATADTQYYFRVYDVATDEAIDKASGETYPNLTTATYSLQILAEDKNIGFTDYGLPGSGTSTHVFTSDEEIHATDWTGNGNGWSVTASATDLDDGTHLIANSNIDWTTGTIYALYGADTTNVTTACAPCNLDSQQTIFSASSGYGKGSYYIQPTVVLTISEDDFVGDYVSEVTLTIS